MDSGHIVISPVAFDTAVKRIGYQVCAFDHLHKIAIGVNQDAGDSKPRIVALALSHESCSLASLKATAQGAI